MPRGDAGLCCPLPFPSRLRFLFSSLSFPLLFPMVRISKRNRIKWKSQPQNPKEFSHHHHHIVNSFFSLVFVSLFFFLFFSFAIANPLRSNTIHNAHKPSQSLADNNTHNYHGDDGDGGYYC